ncbi:MAG: hypothetical protein Q8L84_04925 [Hyphomonas sp.]|nr:hypothetical protein [Hyphomonas sp.]
MIPMRTFRSDPHFAELFARVHVICWPILWWQLNALFRWCKREGIPDVLYSVNPWGFITLRHHGGRQDPHTYKPATRTFRPLTDESWASDLPACLYIGADAALLRDGDVLRSLRRSRKGALPSPQDTS